MIFIKFRRIEGLIPPSIDESTQEEYAQMVISGSKSQLTNHILMVRPAAFYSNTETQATNAFQSKAHDLTPEEIHQLALGEFDGMVNQLRDRGITVHVVEDILNPSTPDSIFPNNWISFHSDGSVVLYPMLNKNRRLEVRPEIIQILETECGVQWSHRHDLTPFQDQAAYLEGTGSLILDRVNRVTYACLSPRTTIKGLKEFSTRMNYEVISFEAQDENQIPFYHTNVMLSIGEGFALVCLDSIVDPAKREKIQLRLEETNHTVIAISQKQVAQFAGNILSLKNSENQQLIVLSKAALSSLEIIQKEKLEKFGDLVSIKIPTIEKYGGGGVRCMMAEVHIP